MCYEINRQHSTETERQRDRETQRETHRERQRARKAQRERERDRQTDRQTDRQRKRETETDRQRVYVRPCVCLSVCVCVCASSSVHLIFLIFLNMEHSSVLTSLSTAQIGSFRFYITLLTLSSRSKTNLISNGVLYLNIPVSFDVVFLSFIFLSCNANISCVLFSGLYSFCCFPFV